MIWRWRPIAQWCVMALAGAIAMSGCTTPGSSVKSQPDVILTHVDAGLRSPEWASHSNELIALTDDGRLAAISHPDDPGAIETRLSAPLKAGRNLQISQADDRHVFVPQPQQNRVVVVDLANLQQLGTFDAGPSPAYLSEDAGMRVLLVLSADGSAVTPVEEHGFRSLPAAKITSGAAMAIDGSSRGRAIEYHAYGPAGLYYFKGTSSPPQQRGVFSANVVAAASDTTTVTRSYVATDDRSTLRAIDTGRGGHGMEEVGRASVSSPIRYLGADSTRVYVATDSEVMVFEAASFTGYPDATIPLLWKTDYRAGLPSGPVHSAQLSGMAIGLNRVYLTLQGQPAVVSVAKPQL